MTPLLALRLYGYLSAVHAKWGIRPDTMTDMLHVEDAVYHQVGETGVLAFLGDYCLAAWPPREQPLVARKVHQLIGNRLKERGFTLHMVYPLNFRSVQVTRKMGAKPLGVDKDGFVHYRLNRESYPYGKEIAAAEAA